METTKKTWVIFKPLNETPIATVLKAGTTIEGDNFEVYESELRWNIAKKELKATEIKGN